MSTEDRRAPGATRIPFDGLVEVGGALGPAFEAQAVNLSEDGMLLRTAYLPDPGQPLTCRFEAGPNESVLASGEVVWAHGAEKGGEFAIRFTDMDAESVDALKRACGVSEQAPEAAAPALAQAGSKVRLHIEGLASPMRAKIKDAHQTEITVGSELGFLQVGRQLELEDATNGCKRPASIDRVEVAVDPASHVPQLVVTLRYADVEAADEAPRARPSSAAAESPSAKASDADSAEVEEASIKMKGGVARSFARIGPAVEKLAMRAKTTIALLAAKRAMRGDEREAPRRTTAPAPGGGLHTAGRKVVRGEQGAPVEETIGAGKMKITKRKAAIGGAVMIAAILGGVLIKKTHHETPPEPASASARDTAAAPPPTAVADTAPAFPPPMTPSTPVSNAPPIDPGSAFGAPPPTGAIANLGDDPESGGKGAHKKHGKVTPFGNGPVHHGNVLHLKLDGPIEALEGAQQPTGFAVKIPGRKSLEAAGPLAARDSRIAAIKVSNDPAGAELTVAFKDGVPNYQVSSKGDTLVIMLAPAGQLQSPVAKADGKGGHAPKHGKHDHKKTK